MKKLYLLIWLLIASIISTSCGGSGGGSPGENGLTIGSIQGPDSLYEYASGQFSISVSGDTGIDVGWSCEPESVGNIIWSPNSRIKFFALGVDADEQVLLTASVYSDHYGPEIVKKTVLVKDDPITANEGWARVWGDGWCWLEGVANCSGEILIAGYFMGAVDFDPGPGIQGHVSYDDKELFLSRFDLLGNLQSASIGSDASNEMASIRDDFNPATHVDGLGNVYYTGKFEDTIDLDRGPGVDEHIASGKMDIYLSKYNDAGEFQWGHTWGGPAFGVLQGFEHASTDVGFGVCTDNSGNVFVAGCFAGIVDFDPGPGVDEHSTGDAKDIFLSKFDPDGNFLWTRTWGSGGKQDFGRAVAVDSSGNVFVTGYFNGTVDFNPGSGIAEYQAEHEETFLSKFDNAGNFLWVRVWSGISEVYGYDIAVDSAGCAYITGRFSDTLDFDPGPDVAEQISSSSGAFDIFLIKVLPDGNW